MNNLVIANVQNTRRSQNSKWCRNCRLKEQDEETKQRLTWISTHLTGEKILVSWYIKNICQSARLPWVTPTDRALRPSWLLDHSVAKEIVSVVTCIHMYCEVVVVQHSAATFSILSDGQLCKYVMKSRWKNRDPLVSLRCIWATRS